MSKRLEGRVAIVTGGSRGIGACIARAFAREGASVVLASRKQPGVDEAAAAINQDYPNTAWGRACHIGKAEAVAELVDWTTTEIGMPTVLVNNAATNPYFGPLLNVESWAWDKTFEVNLKGYFETTRQVVQGLVRTNTSGSIINVASVVGLCAAPMQGVYGMTKAAIISMTKTLAIELGAADIRVNAIAPGLVDTRLASLITSTVDMSKLFTERTAMKRIAKPEEIAEIAVYLGSDESSYVTGQTICVDGGYTVS